MRLIGLDQENLEYVNSSSPESNQYFFDRLKEAEAFKFACNGRGHQVEERLENLIDQIDAQGAELFISHRQDISVSKAGKTVNEELFTKLDELLLYLGNPIRKPKQFIQPIKSDGYVIGYILAQISAEKCTSFVEDVLETYADLILHELELMKKENTLQHISKKLQKKKEELEKAQQYNNNLLSITSHDLSSPLNAVSGYLDLMNDCFKEESKKQKIKNYHQRIRSGVEEMSDMLRQLSNVSKIERGTISLDMVKVNLCWLVRRVFDLLEGTAIEKDIQFDLETPDIPIYVKADTVKLKRVIRNLISNAIKYTDNGGKVSVKIGQDDGLAFFRVKDNGIGIPESHYSKIFAPFVKLEQSAEFSSSGLGLYVASYFADLMNGEIEVESKEDVGSIFTVSLPKIKPQNFEKSKAD